jgi:hypothetical protein
MDTSKEYIKMCEAAVEIQAAWNSTCGEFDVYVEMKIESGQTWVRYRDIEFYMENEKEEYKHIWLPRQDQLQDMVVSIYSNNDIKLLNSFSKYILKDYEKYMYCSMEQLWLAFVMKEIYNKIWSDGKWEVKLKAK